MSERDFDRFSDEEFERFLQDEASGMNVTEKTVKSVNPWKKSTDMIFAGLILQLFTVNIYYLNHILPALGMLLVLFGFRVLSGENKWFMTGKITAYVKCASWIVNRFLDSTMWLDSNVEERFSMSMGYFNAILMLIIIGCLWGGFRLVQKKSNMPVHTLSFAVLFLAYFLLAIATFIVKDAVLLPLIFAVAFIVILVCIRKIFKKISVSGYAVDPKPVKIPNFVIVLILAVLTIGSMFIGNTFFTSYPMDFKSVESTINAEVESAKLQLLDKGFPEEVLVMMTDDDIMQCKNPVRVVVKESETFETDGWQKNLRLQTIMVQLPNDEETWKIIHSFCWEKVLTKHHSDCIQFTPIYYNKENCWVKSGEISGRIFYNEGTKIFASEYYSIIEGAIGKSAKQNVFSDLWGSGEGKMQAVAEFTFPKDAENCRGYISYNAVNAGRAHIANSYFTYTHDDEFVYPYKKASDYRWESSTLSGKNTDSEVLIIATEKELGYYDYPKYIIYE